MGLFRCAPQSPHRYIFNWIHRSICILAVVFSIPTLFLVASVLHNYLPALMMILSLWTGWILIIVVVVEVIKSRCQSKPSTVGIKIGNAKDAHELNSKALQRASNTSSTQNPELGKFDNLKLFLFASNFIVPMTLAIPLVALLRQQ